MSNYVNAMLGQGYREYKAGCKFRKIYSTGHAVLSMGQWRTCMKQVWRQMSTVSVHKLKENYWLSANNLNCVFKHTALQQSKEVNYC